MSDTIISFIFGISVIIISIIYFLVKCVLEGRAQVKEDIEYQRYLYKGHNFSKEYIEKIEKNLKSYYGKYYYPPYNLDKD